MSARQDPLRFAAFTQNTSSFVYHGLWRQPDGLQRRFNELEFWVDVAKILDEGGFDAMFFADVLGLDGIYRGSSDVFIETGLQFPINDPLVLVSALASHTKHLGFAFTSGPMQQPPFNFARQMATLDHASHGRLGWNIVTSLYGWENFNHAKRLEHDARYELAQEYADVVYKLWEGSWDDDALEQDLVTGRHADPAKVHRINHVSEHYSVRGPFLVTPSPQRTPLLFQAGSSEAGKRFAARNAEAVFIVARSPETAAPLIAEITELASTYGRRREDLKFFQGMSFVIGSTEEEARRKEQELNEQLDAEAQIAQMGSVMGIDFGKYEADTPLDIIETDGGQTNLRWLAEVAPGREPKLRDVALGLADQGRFVGTPEQIADRLAQWRDAGVDGVNLNSAMLPGSYVEFIDHVMPVLRARGLAAPLPSPDDPIQTLRQRWFGTDRLNDRHPAAQYRGAFSDVPA